MRATILVLAVCLVGCIQQAEHPDPAVAAPAAGDAVNATWNLFYVGPDEVTPPDILALHAFDVPADAQCEVASRFHGRTLTEGTAGVLAATLDEGPWWVYSRDLVFPHAAAGDVSTQGSGPTSYGTGTPPPGTTFSGPGRWMHVAVVAGMLDLSLEVVCDQPITLAGAWMANATLINTSQGTGSVHTNGMHTTDNISVQMQVENATLVFFAAGPSGQARIALGDEAVDAALEDTPAMLLGPADGLASFQVEGPVAAEYLLGAVASLESVDPVEDTTALAIDGRGPAGRADGRDT